MPLRTKEGPYCYSPDELRGRTAYASLELKPKWDAVKLTPKQRGDPDWLRKTKEYCTGLYEAADDEFKFKVLPENQCGLFWEDDLKNLCATMIHIEQTHDTIVKALAALEQPEDAPPPKRQRSD